MDEAGRKNCLAFMGYETSTSSPTTSAPIPPPTPTSTGNGTGGSTDAHKTLIAREKE